MNTSNPVDKIMIAVFTILLLILGFAILPNFLPVQQDLIDSTIGLSANISGNTTSANITTTQVNMISAIPYALIVIFFIGVPLVIYFVTKAGGDINV